MTVYVAFYRHWPEAVTLVGVFSSEKEARWALARSLAPPETGGEVLSVMVDEGMDLELTH